MKWAIILLAPRTRTRRAELVFQAAKGAFHYGAFGKAMLLGPGHHFGADFGIDDAFPRARVLEQRNFALAELAQALLVLCYRPMSELQTVLTNRTRVISRVH